MMRFMERNAPGWEDAILTPKRSPVAGIGAARNLFRHGEHGDTESTEKGKSGLTTENTESTEKKDGFEAFRRAWAGGAPGDGL
jgi:hypothetical protein